LVGTSVRPAEILRVGVLAFVDHEFVELIAEKEKP
jgi:hypothetical protein